MGTVIGDVHILLRSDNNSAKIRSSKMHDLENDEASEEMVQFLRMARDKSLSTRNAKVRATMYDNGVVGGDKNFRRTLPPPWRCCPGLFRVDPPLYVNLLK